MSLLELMQSNACSVGTFFCHNFCKKMYVMMAKAYFMPFYANCRIFCRIYWHVFELVGKFCNSYNKKHKGGV